MGDQIGERYRIRDASNSYLDKCWYYDKVAGKSVIVIRDEGWRQVCVGVFPKQDTDTAHTKRNETKGRP